jgi:steroid 5-alpha reductase family enzyme
MTFWEIYLIAAAMIVLVMTGLWLLSLVLRDASIYEDYVRTTSAFIPWFPKKIQP